ncbi:tetratricopeptide repeat protein, partial [bacterium AH-315-L15]|nr:tetratricopeptide repeat protein [bacterium AH-315-L15]
DRAMATLQEIIKIDPDHVSAYFNLGNLAAQKTLYDQAEAFLKKAIEINPEFTEAYQRLGQVYEVTRLFRLATEQYKKGLETHRGKVLPMKDVLEQSIARSEAAKKEVLSAAEAAFRKGEKALEDGLFDEATGYLEQVVFFNPEDSEARLKLVPLYERKDRNNLAYLTLRLVIGRLPEHVEAHRQLARLDEKGGFYYQALKRWRAHGGADAVLARLEKTVNEIDAKTAPLVTQAMEAAKAGKHEEAIEILSKAQEHAPDDPRIRLLLGRMYTKASMKKEALDALNAAGFFELSDGQASYYLGELYVTSKQWEQARSHYDNALASEAISETLRSKVEKARSQAIRSRRDLKTAERLFNRARRAHIAENYRDALAGYQSVLGFFPSDFSSLYWTARVYEKLNEFDEAKKYYLKVLTINANHIDSNRRLGVLYEGDGQNEEAIGYYRHYLSLWRGQENAETIWVKARLKPLAKRFHVTVNQVVLSYDSNPEQSSNPDSDIRSNLGIGLTYLLRKNRGLQIPINISTDNTFFFRSNTVFSKETFGISAIRVRRPFLYSIAYNFQYGLASGGPTGLDHVGSFNLTRFSKKASSVALGYTFNTFISKQDKDFDATRHTLRLTYFKRWGEKSVSVWYRFFDNGAKLNDQASLSNGLGFSYDWTPMNKIETSFIYRVNRVDFDHIDSLGNKRRKNLLQSASLSATYRLQKGVALNASYIEQHNDSNLPSGAVTLEQQLSGQAASLGDYSQRIVSLNLTWSF